MLLRIRQCLSQWYWRVVPLRIVRYHLYRVNQFVKSVARDYDRSGTTLIDIGSEDGQYRTYFKHLRYVTQDVKQNASGTINIIGDLNEGIPSIPDYSYDYILCTQVLEHIREPQKAFQEFHRILKPGGKLFLTTHQSFEEHMIPFDYFRFTRYGLKYLGESHGFTLDHIVPHGGIFHVLALVVDTIPVKTIFKKGLSYYAYGVIFTIPIILFNSLCAMLDILDREKIMTLNYECIYTKRDHV